MAQEEFYLAHEPEPTRILGVDLRPYSLGHIILLSRLGSSFVLGGEPTLDDLAVTVFFCSLSYEEGRSVLCTGKVDVQTRWGIRRLSLDDAMARWHRRIGEFDFSEKVKEVEAYMKAGSRHPMVSSKHGYNPDTLACDCPFVQEVKVVLMSRMHFKEAEILDRPWSKCLWDYYTLLMIDGDLRIVDGTAIESAQSVADELQGKIDRGEVKFDFKKEGTHGV